MNATDLMIGDWVKYESQHEKVSEIYSAGIYVRGLMGDENKGYPFEHLEPIMLTCEILEKNGFKLIAVGDYGLATPKANINRYEKWKCTTNKTFYVYYDKRSKEYSLTAYLTYISNILYVHELQHALRMCGIEKEIEL